MRQIKQTASKIVKEKSFAIEAYDRAMRKKCKVSEKVIVSENQLNNLCIEMEEKSKNLFELKALKSLKTKNLEELEQGVQHVKQQKEFLKNNECQVDKYSLIFCLLNEKKR